MVILHGMSVSTKTIIPESCHSFNLLFLCRLYTMNGSNDFSHTQLISSRDRREQTHHIAL